MSRVTSEEFNLVVKSDRKSDHDVISYHLSRILRVPVDFFTSVVEGAPGGGNPSEAGSDAGAGVESGSSWNLQREYF